ncbi:MAG TPA: RHS repeat-associated core domain-containing protein [Polyangia bacterium]|nr:RHS repeat-associated core domain-containing protein [Polyangia bacterium]
MAIAVGPDGTPYYLDQRGSCLRVMKLEADGRTSQVAGGDCTNLVAGGDGGPASAATFKVIGALPMTPPADLAVGQDGSIYVTNQSECRVRRIWPSGIIDTVAGSTCPSAGSHTGDGGLATAARMKPTSIAIGRDDALFIGDYDYWEVPCGSGGDQIPGCYGYGSGTWMAPRSRIRLVRNGLIDSIAGAQVTNTIMHSSALQRPIGIPVDLAIGADQSVYYVESQAGNIGLTSNPQDDYPHAIRRIGIVMPGVPQAGGTVLASQNGRELFNFNRSGQHVSTQDALTGAIQYQFGYDAAGMLATITDASGLVTTLERDTDTGLATAIVAPNGQRTVLTMTEDGYLAAIDEPGGARREFSYDSGGLLQTYKKPNQATASFTYDEMGRLVHEDMPGGGSWTLTRTGPTPQDVSAPVHVSTVSAEGKTWTCNGVTDSNGNETLTNSGPSGLQSIVASTQAGVTTEATPDGMSWSVTEVADPRFGMQAPVPATTVVTTPGGKAMTTTIARTVTTSGANLVSQVDKTTVNGKAFTSTYNVAAKTITSVSPLGRQTVSTLDAQGRVLQVQAGNLAPTAYTYDSRGRLASVTVGNGTSARVTTFGYDDLDRLSSVTDPLLRVQSYVYDDANRVVGQVFTDGSEVEFSYDANGNVTSVTPPSRPEHDFGYTPADLMSSYTPPVVAGTGATTYEYNLDKQPTVVHRPDGSQIVTTYDSAGRVSTTTYPKGPSTSDGTVTVTRAYSPTTGKLVSASTSDGQTVTYGYDGSLLLSTTWSGTVAGSVSRTFNNDFRMASQSVNGANSVAFGYDNDGLLTSADGLTITRDAANGLISDTTLGQVTDHRTYDSDGLLATYEAKFGTTSLYSVAYVRDSLGRIEQKTETIQGATTVWVYSYDSAGRLWQVMQNGVLTATYLYDANGNRLSRTTPDGTDSATYDDQDRLLTYGKWSYTYTANGELRSKTDTSTGQVTIYGYDAQGNLRHVGLPDGRSIDYVIDAEDRRVAKKINGAVVKMWIYKNQLKPVAELDGTGNLLARYIDWVTVKGSTSYRVIKDSLGTPRLVVNGTTGTVAQRLDLDQWGQVVADSSAGFQVFGFAGGIYDPDTGLVRFGARDYDPVVGRWTAKDPIRFAGGQGGLYVYVMNDPINNRDPSGLGILDWCKDIWHWLTARSFSKKYKEAIHSSEECRKAQEDLVDKMFDGEATDEDNDAAEAKCGKRNEDIKETIKKGADVVTESYMHQ